MQGIELSRRFYTEIVAPWLRQEAPQLRYAAALIGYGSELLGFDDELSRDHNWGPRVLIVLSGESLDDEVRRLVPAFAQVAPAAFEGEPIHFRSRPHAPANDADSAGDLAHGLEFHTLGSLLGRHIGRRSVEALGLVDWLGFAEQKLLAFTAGAVFHDNDGALSAARQALAYYPDDVWHYRIACQWRRIAEEQAFVGRAGQVGDELGSRVVAARLVRDAMRLGFLIERRYAPYSKWLGSGFARLPLAPTVAPLLMQALEATEWQARGEALGAAYLALAEAQNSKGIARFEPRLGPYFERPFVTINTDDAVGAAQAAIVDPWLRALPVIGGLDQVSDLTPLLEDAALSQQVMHTLLA